MNGTKRLQRLALACGIALGGLVMSPSASAEECLPGFGPGCVTPYPAPPTERIPIHPAALNPIWVGGLDYVTPFPFIVDRDFVVLTVTLPDGHRVAGISAACRTDAEHPSCPNLALFALYDLRLRLDQALRARP